MKTFTKAPPADQDVGRQITGLYQAHAHGLVKLAVLMVGDQLTAEDIVQEAFLSLYHRWQHLRDKDKALSYLRSGVLNGCRDIHRTKYRRQAIALNHLHFLSSGDATVSPDGSTLAIYSPSSFPANGVVNGPGSTLRTYSIATGKLLRTWTVPAGSSFEGPWTTAAAEGNGAMVARGSADSLQWLADGHTLAWTGAPSPAGSGWTVQTLNTTSPGTSLVANSRTVFRLTGNSCVDPLLTSDGKSVICGSRDMTPGSKACGEPALASYSVATGKLDHVLYRYAGTCQASFAEPEWAPSGSLVIGMVEGTAISGTAAAHDVHTKTTTDVGAMTPTKFTLIPTPQQGAQLASGVAF